MKKFFLSALIIPALLLSTVTITEASTKVMWGKTELRKGQIGKIILLNTAQLYQNNNEGILGQINRPLRKGEEFRVYSFKSKDGGYYGLGGGLFVKKSNVVKYETPSKAKLALLEDKFLSSTSKAGEKYSDGWVAPVLESAWSSNHTDNLKTLEKELGFKDGSYGNRLLYFSNHPALTVYGSTQVAEDFGNYRVLQGGNRLKIDDLGRLRFKLPKGSVGSSQGGGIIKADIAKKDTYTFEYEVHFDQNFPWSKGGKLPGLSGGVGYTGGTPAWNGDGFSIRIMWREDGKLIPNVYHKEQPGNYGDTFGATIGYLTDGKPHKIKYWVKLNTGSNHDGILKIYLDDELKFEKRDIVYRTDDSKIDTAHIAVFPGGSTKDWKMTNTGYIRFNWIKWE